MKERTEIQEGGRLTVCKISECVLCVTVFYENQWVSVCLCVCCVYAWLRVLYGGYWRAEKRNE